MPELITPPAVAEMWGVSPETVRRAIRTGQIPALTTPGGHYRVRRDLAEHVRRVVDQAPPLSPEQGSRIAALIAAA